MPAISYTLLIGVAPGTPPIPPLLPGLIDALQKIEIETSTDMASVFRLRFGITQTKLGDWTILQEDLFRPLVAVQIWVLIAPGLPQAIINGYVSSQQVIYDDEAGGSVLEVTGMDATMLMNLQEKVMAWPMTDNAIAMAIFAQYGILTQAIPTPPGLIEPEGTTTQRGTDIRFLRRLAQRNGFKCFVQPQPQSGIDVGYFGPPLVPPALPDAVINVKMGPQTNVGEFKIRYEMLRPTTTVAAGIDTRTRAPQVAPALTVLYPLSMGLEGSLLRILPPYGPPITLPADTGEMHLPELLAMAQGVTDNSAWAVVAEGSVGSDVGVLRPGNILNVRGAGRVFNGAYYVTRVSHILDSCGSYSQRFEARRNAVGMTGAEIYIKI